MIWNFKYGFEYKGLNYGWKDKSLYRLPSEKKHVNYPLKKVPLIEIGNKKGYRVCRDRKTIDQLKELETEINYKYEIRGSGHFDTPY